MQKLFIVLLVLLSPVLSSAADRSLDEQCKVLSDAVVKYMTDNKIVDYSVVTAGSFHSSRLGTCIHTEIADSGEIFKIRDLGKNVIKDGPDYFNTLFYCDHNGANSVKLDVVKKHDGKVFELSHRQWQDDGFGGLPAALKTPEKPYTKAICKKLYTDWIRKTK